MTMKANRLFVILILILTVFSCSNENIERPNIIIILADDLGYGDIQAFNSSSSIPTPNLNKLSEEGIMFRDAHSPSSICTPTRYGLLTGRYCWRTSLKRGVLKGYDPPLIEEGRSTIADYLQDIGYTTGIVGKWHLGLGFQETLKKNNGSIGKFDLTKTLHSSPNDNGFDYSFVLPASLDFEPYVYVRNYQVVDTEFDSVPTTKFPHFWREGIKSKSLEFENVLDDLLLEAKAFISSASRSKDPFFLYFPLTAPHKPVIPSKKFIGTSKKGLYGDFISQVDWTAGKVLELVEELGIEDNTLVIFTSDNGSPMYSIHPGVDSDHVTNEGLAFYNATNHRANGKLRGIKGDTFEGGHRIPFILRWPAKLNGGIKVDTTICLTDIYATLVELTGGKVKEGNAEDSFSFYSIIDGEEKSINRPSIIHHSGGKGMFAIRSDKWKMIFGNGSGARTKPVGIPFQKPYQLYDLEADLAETENLIDLNASKAHELEEEFAVIRGDD